MLLDGAKFISLNHNGEPVDTIIAKGRNFLIGCQVDCDCILEGAEKIHCQIECDAFGHVTICNKSEKQPICVNGETVSIKRTLFNNSKIKILDKEYLWKLPKTNLNVTLEKTEQGMSTPDKQIGIPIQPPNSCPTLKYHRNISNRFTVHNLRSYRIESDESNLNNDGNETTQNTLNVTEKAAADDCTSSNKSLLDHTPIKAVLIDSTPDKKTSSTEKRNKAFRNVWGWSGLTSTSYSPREAGIRVEKTFTAIIAPKTPNSSLCRTPKGVLARLGVEKLDQTAADLIAFATPSKEDGNNVVEHKKSAMKILDLTTPSKLRPESPFPKTLSTKKSNVVKSLASFSEKTIKVNISSSMTPLLQTPKTILNTETPISTSSAITVDSSSGVSDTDSVVTSTTPLKTQTTHTTTPGSILRKQALLASAHKQKQQPTPILNLPSCSKISTSAANTPVSSKSKIGATTVEKKTASVTKTLPTTKKFNNSINSKVDSSIKKTANSQKNTENVVETLTPDMEMEITTKNFLTTSTPYKVLNNENIENTQQQDTTEFFSALHSSTEEEEEQQLQKACNEPTVVVDKTNEGGDELLQEIKEILSTSDEIKKQIQYSEIETAGDVGPKSVSPIPTSIELIEPIIPPTDLKSTTKKNAASLVLLKAINNAEKQLLRPTKEDEEKENKKINESLTTTTTGVRSGEILHATAATPTTTTTSRRISFSATTTTPAAAVLIADDVGSSVIGTPLTPKRITKRRPSIDGNITHERTIDHLNTENMGAIIEDDNEAPSPAAMLETEIDQVDKDCTPHITLDASAALTTSVCPGKETRQQTIEINATEIDDNEAVMSPLQCLDESFAEPCNNENKFEDQEKIVAAASSISSSNTKDSIKTVKEQSKVIEIQLSKENDKDEGTLELDESFGEIAVIEDKELSQEINSTQQENNENELNRTFEIEVSKSTIEHVEKQLTHKKDSIIEVLSEEENEAENLEDLQEPNTTADRENIEQEKRNSVFIEPTSTISIVKNNKSNVNNSEIVDLTLNESLDTTDLNETDKTFEVNVLLEKTTNAELNESRQIFNSLNVTELTLEKSTINEESQKTPKAQSEIEEASFEVTIIEEHSKISEASILQEKSELNETSKEKLSLETPKKVNETQKQTEKEVTLVLDEEESITAAELKETNNEIEVAEGIVNLSMLPKSDETTDNKMNEEIILLDESIELNEPLKFSDSDEEKQEELNVTKPKTAIEKNVETIDLIDEDSLEPKLKDKAAELAPSSLDVEKEIYFEDMQTSSNIVEQVHNEAENLEVPDKEINTENVSLEFATTQEIEHNESLTKIVEKEEIPQLNEAAEKDETEVCSTPEALVKETPEMVSSNNETSLEAAKLNETLKNVFSNDESLSLEACPAPEALVKETPEMVSSNNETSLEAAKLNETSKNISSNDESLSLDASPTAEAPVIETPEMVSSNNETSLEAAKLNETPNNVSSNDESLSLEACPALEAPVIETTENVSSNNETPLEAAKLNETPKNISSNDESLSLEVSQAQEEKVNETDENVLSNNETSLEAAKLNETPKSVPSNDESLSLKACPTPEVPVRETTEKVLSNDESPLEAAKLNETPKNVSSNDESLSLEACPTAEALVVKTTENVLANSEASLLEAEKLNETNGNVLQNSESSLEAEKFQETKHDESSAEMKQNENAEKILLNDETSVGAAESQDTKLNESSVENKQNLQSPQLNETAENIFSKNETSLETAKQNIIDENIVVNSEIVKSKEAKLNESSVEIEDNTKISQNNQTNEHLSLSLEASTSQETKLSQHSPAILKLNETCEIALSNTETTPEAVKPQETKIDECSEEIKHSSLVLELNETVENKKSEDSKPEETAEIEQNEILILKDDKSNETKLNETKERLNKTDFDASTELKETKQTVLNETKNQTLTESVTELNETATDINTAKTDLQLLSNEAKIEKENGQAEISVSQNITDKAETKPSELEHEAVVETIDLEPELTESNREIIETEVKANESFEVAEVAQNAEPEAKVIADQLKEEHEFITEVSNHEILDAERENALEEFKPGNGSEFENYEIHDKSCEAEITGVRENVAEENIGASTLVLETQSESANETAVNDNCQQITENNLSKTEDHEIQLALESSSEENIQQLSDNTEEQNTEKEPTETTETQNLTIPNEVTSLTANYLESSTVEESKVPNEKTTEKTASEVEEQQMLVAEVMLNESEENILGTTTKSRKSTDENLPLNIEKTADPNEVEGSITEAQASSESLTVEEPISNKNLENLETITTTEEISEVDLDQHVKDISKEHLTDKESPVVTAEIKKQQTVSEEQVLSIEENKNQNSDILEVTAEITKQQTDSKEQVLTVEENKSHDSDILEEPQKITEVDFQNTKEPELNKSKEQLPIMEEENLESFSSEKLKESMIVELVDSEATKIEAEIHKQQRQEANEEDAEINDVQQAETSEEKSAQPVESIKPLTPVEIEVNAQTSNEIEDESAQKETDEKQNETENVILNKEESLETTSEVKEVLKDDEVKAAIIETENKTVDIVKDEVTENTITTEEQITNKEKQSPADVEEKPTVSRSQRGLRQRAAVGPKYDETSDTESKTPSRKRRSGGDGHKNSPKKQNQTKKEETAEEVPQKTTAKRGGRKKKLEMEEKNETEIKTNKLEESIKSTTTNIPKKRARKNTEEQHEIEFEDKAETEIEPDNENEQQKTATKRRGKAAQATNETIETKKAPTRRRGAKQQHEMQESEVESNVVHENLQTDDAPPKSTARRGRAKKLDKTVEEEEKNVEEVHSIETIEEVAVEKKTSAVGRKGRNLKTVTIEHDEAQESKTELEATSQKLSARKPRRGRKASEIEHTDDENISVIAMASTSKSKTPTKRRGKAVEHIVESEEVAELVPMKRSRRLNSQIEKLDITETHEDEQVEETKLEIIKEENVEEEVVKKTTKSRGGRRGVKHIDDLAEETESLESVEIIKKTTKARGRGRGKKLEDLDEQNVEEKLTGVVEEVKTETLTKSSRGGRRGRKPTVELKHDDIIEETKNEAEVEVEVIATKTTGRGRGRGKKQQQQQSQHEEQQHLSETTAEIYNEKEQTPLVDDKPTAARNNRRGVSPAESIEFPTTSKTTKRSNKRTKETFEDIQEVELEAEKVIEAQTNTTQSTANKNVRGRRGATKKQKTLSELELDDDDETKSSTATIDEVVNSIPVAVEESAPKKQSRGRRIQKETTVGETKDADKLTAHHKRKQVHFNEATDSINEIENTTEDQSQAIQKTEEPTIVAEAEAPKRRRRR